MNGHEGPGPATEPARDYYQRRVEQCTSQERQLRRRERTVSRCRGVIFLVAVALLLVGYARPETRAVWIVTGSAIFVGFVVAVAYHEQILTTLARTRLTRRIHREHLARLERRWDHVPVTDVTIPNAERPVAHDLDLFGKGSLFHLMCTAYSPLGIALLRDWLIQPADCDEIVQRQKAVAQLVPERALREELALRGRLLSSSLAGPETFLAWAEGPPWLGRRPVLRWLTRISPCVGLAALFLGLCGVAPLEMGITFTAFVVLNMGISVLFTGPVHDIFNRITSRHGEIQHYQALFELIRHMPRGCAHLARIHRDVDPPRRGALHQLRRLRRVMRLANLRRDPLFGILYIFIQILSLWDFHVLTLVERWQRHAGKTSRQWFEALARLEALASLAGLADAQPTWSFAAVQPQAKTVQAHGLGHPLLPDRTRVTNDVTVGPAGTVLLVTGSNMSGKSTLLRALGINAIIAQAGGPVCAQRLTMPPLEVTTSMRIDDSLVDGVSLYMAELKRLKQIVDQAALFEHNRDRTLFYVLDEVLQGTNSVERHIAVGRVISCLVARGAMGAVSTHDLALAQSDGIVGACDKVHFAETFVDEGGTRRMIFDYKLRPGLATTTNALILLEMVGLPPAPADE